MYGGERDYIIPAKCHQSRPLAHCLLPGHTVRTQPGQLSLHKWRLLFSTGDCVLRVLERRGVTEEEEERNTGTDPARLTREMWGNRKGLQKMECSQADSRQHSSTQNWWGGQDNGSEEAEAVTSHSSFGTEPRNCQQ